MNKYYTIEMFGGDCGFKPVILKGYDKAHDVLEGYRENANESMRSGDAPPHGYMIADAFDTLKEAVDECGGRCYNDTGETYKYQGGN
tara:strand:- start:930 stop:1190 length:261 start_codon:yes stop_codon:yes gene_type:complete